MQLIMQLNCTRQSKTVMTNKKNVERCIRSTRSQLLHVIIVSFLLYLKTRLRASRQIIPLSSTRVLLRAYSDKLA